jgi:hypothetical protein
VNSSFADAGSGAFAQHGPTRVSAQRGLTSEVHSPGAARLPRWSRTVWPRRRIAAAGLLRAARVVIVKSSFVNARIRAARIDE